nr:MAG TPA: protein of unknown function DUF3244 [Bacteriophage sp.]
MSIWTDMAIYNKKNKEVYTPGLNNTGDFAQTLDVTVHAASTDEVKFASIVCPLDGTLKISVGTRRTGSTSGIPSYGFTTIIVKDSSGNVKYSVKGTKQQEEFVFNLSVLGFNKYTFYFKNDSNSTTMTHYNPKDLIVEYNIKEKSIVTLNDESV